MPPATLADVMRHGHDLAIDCLDCRRVAVVPPVELAMRVGEGFPVPRLYEDKRLKMHSLRLAQHYHPALRAARATHAGMMMPVASSPR